MSNKVKNVEIKIRAFSMILSIQKLLIKVILKQVKKLKYVKINSVSLLHLVFNKVNGYFEDINKNKYLTLFPTNESKKKVLKIWKFL